MTTHDTRIGGELRGVRWTGTLAITAGVLAVVAIDVTSLAYLGLAGFWASWINTLPWVGVILFGLGVRYLSGVRSAAASLGLAVLGAVLVGPTVLAAGARLKWWQNAEVWPSPSPISGSARFPEDLANALIGVGSGLLIVASVLVAVAAWIPVSRVVRIPGSSLPQTPFRIESLTIIFLIFIVGTASANFEWSFVGAYAQVTTYALLFSWLIPLTVVLSLSLRSSGLGSVGVIVGLVTVFILEPLLRRLSLAFYEGSDLLSATSWWYQEPGVSADSGMTPLAVGQGIAVPVVFLTLLVLLWNSQTPPDVPASKSPTTYAAPIEPWAGVSVILAAIPPFSIAAVVLAHMSYERVLASQEAFRGRILAAFAIVLGMLVTSIPILAYFGVLANFERFWSIG